jgi:hypothetical protein
MVHIVVLGAGLGGIPMAYEMKKQMRSDDTLFSGHEVENENFTTI